MSSPETTAELAARLQGSLLEFTRVMFQVRTGREFELSNPPGRESHYITICKALREVYDGKVKRLIINVPPRYGKTELLIHFVAWALARNPNSNFLYISYSHTLAAKQTKIIRDILKLPIYQQLFGVRILGESSAKDNFETNKGGSVYAAGAAGTITGQGAGIKGYDGFGGTFIMDDMHKPEEVTSDTIRKGVIDWFHETASSRVNAPAITPMIFIGQRLHEDDLPAHLIASGEWKVISLPALDEANRPLNPKTHTLEMLLEMKEAQPYVFASQYQQDPQPAGGALFKPEWFVLKDETPKMLATFITCDTAETDKDYNDATVFSFWGVYKISIKEIDTDIYALHWIDCREIRVEPADLENNFFEFYAACMRFSVKPTWAAVEKKSTGVTLTSILHRMQGLQILNIERTARHFSKAKRYIEMQPYIAKGLISLPKYAQHTNMCIDHMRKITPNNTHAHDDICDTAYDAVKLGLIDKTITNIVSNQISQKDDNIMAELLQYSQQIDNLREKAYG